MALFLLLKCNEKLLNHVIDYRKRQLVCSPFLSYLPYGQSRWQHTCRFRPTRSSAACPLLRSELRSPTGKIDRCKHQHSDPPVPAEGVK